MFADIDPFEAFAKDFSDLPKDDRGLKPKVWALVECTEASLATNSRVSPPVAQIKTTYRIIESAADENGRKAYGNLWDWLSRPDHEHPEVPPTTCAMQRRQFRSATVAFLAGPAKGKEAEDAAVIDAARGAGGFDKALVGKRALVRIGINDGKNKKGEIVSPQRAEDPMNRIEEYKAATPDNVSRHIHGAVKADSGSIAL